MNTHRSVRGCFSFLASFTLVAAMLLVYQTSGRGADLEKVLSGKICPLSVKLGELDQDWRRITIHTTGNVTGNVSVSVSGTHSSSSSQNNIADLFGSKVYLTKGQTVSVNDRVYLIAYHMPAGGLNVQALIESLATKTPPAAPTLGAETTIPLSLLDLESVGSLDDVRAFDVKTEIAESEKLFKAISTALSAAGGSSAKAPATTSAASQGAPDK